MKKMMIIALLFVSSATFAQRFQIGAKAGGNLSNYTGGNIQSNALFGYHFGGFLNFRFGEIFSVQPEVLYSSQGAKYDDIGGTSTVKVAYIAIPVMAKLKFNTIYIEAGPQFSFKTNESGEVPNLPVNSFAKNLDLSLGAGIGYHAKSGFGIGARYLAGLSKVGDFNTNQTMDPNFRNSVIQLSAFVTLFNNN